MPGEFFTDLLPAIRSALELKVTLHLMWILSQRVGRPRCVEYQDLAGDEELLASLKLDQGPRPAEDFLREGLELAMTRGTALQVQLQRGDRREVWFFLNTAAGRQAVEQLKEGRFDDVHEAIGSLPVDRVTVYRPNIFALYEQNIGPLTPIIAELLRSAERQYPTPWIEEAIRTAVTYNRRSWKYVETILQRWQSEGKDDGTVATRSDEVDPDSWFRTKYAHVYK